jgi:hypothetical protein
MASQRTHANAQKVAAKAVAVFVAIVALAGLQQAVSALCLPFGPVARESLHVVLAVMTAMWQVAEGYFLDPQSSAYCLIHLVVTGGHLVQMAIGAA